MPEDFFAPLTDPNQQEYIARGDPMHLTVVSLLKRVKELSANGDPPAYIELGAGQMRQLLEHRKRNSAYYMKLSKQEYPLMPQRILGLPYVEVRKGDFIRVVSLSEFQKTLEAQTVDLQVMVDKMLYGDPEKKEIVGERSESTRASQSEVGPMYGRSSMHALLESLDKLGGLLDTKTDTKPYTFSPRVMRDVIDDALKGKFDG